MLKTIPIPVEPFQCEQCLNKDDDNFSNWKLTRFCFGLAKLYRLGLFVGVGMTVAYHPLRRSVRALLTHTAPLAAVPVYRRCAVNRVGGFRSMLATVR